MLDKAKVSGQSEVSDHAVVKDAGRVAGHAEVCDRAVVGGKAWVYQNALIKDAAVVTDQACVFGDAVVSGDARVGGLANVGSGARVKRSDHVVVHVPKGAGEDLADPRKGDGPAVWTAYRTRKDGVAVMRGRTPMGLGDAPEELLDAVGWAKVGK